MLSNHNPNVSLLPDNPSAQIMPVQGGGGSGSWHSNPITVENGTYQLALNHGFLKKFKTRWRQTLGPNIPSRRKPRQDPHIIVGSLNAHENPVYLVAPLRGDSDAATRIFSWSDNLLSLEPNTHIVFMGPLVNTKENTSIESAMSALLSKYPGHIIFVSDKETTLPSLDGLLLEAVPHTSKQIALGFIPHHENVYNRSSRNLNKLVVETLRVPYSKRDKEETLGSLYSFKFQAPTTIKGRDRDNDEHDITKDILLKVIPGWVTRITHGSKMSGGASLVKEPLVDTPEEVKKGAEEAKDEVKPQAPAFTGATVSVTLDSDVYNIRNPSDASVINDWSKGKFEGDEIRLLDNEGLRYNNDIYSKFLQGLVNEQCKTEPDVQMRPECGIFRYIMANRYFNQVRFKNGRKPFTRGDTHYSSEAVVTPPVTSEATVTPPVTSETVVTPPVSSEATVTPPVSSEAIVTPPVTSKSTKSTKHVGFSSKSTVRTENESGVHNSNVNTAKKNGNTRGRVKTVRGGTRSKRKSINPTMKLRLFY